MKKRMLLIAVFLVLVFATSSFGASCVMKIDKYPNLNMRVLTFTCTAVATAFTTTSTSTATKFTKADLQGYWISDVMISPGGTAPTDGTAVTLSTDDTPAYDILGGVGVCSATVTKRFGLPNTLPSGSGGGIGIAGDLSIAITGNSVSGAIVILKAFMWNN